MPEGDTIHRAAARLGSALVGSTVNRVAAPRWAGRLPERGETVTGVQARGKHLLVGFSGGLALTTHQRMTGSWHLYRPGERWRKSPSTMRALVETDEWVAVCFLSPDVRFDELDLGGDPEVVTPTTSHLGPDLCRPDADIDECVRRFELLDATVSVADALLDQRICCGVGNVFKSEVCWAAEVDPFRSVAELDEALRRRLVEIATAQLRANLRTSRRTTVPGGLAVYGRTGRACRRCGVAVRSREHGPHARRTYWCPGCQLAP